MSLSFSQYDQFLKENKLSTDQQQSDMIKRVGTRISKAVEEYFAHKNMSGELSGYQWEFNLAENEQVNAWAMPGGKVGFLYWHPSNNANRSGSCSCNGS